MVLHAVSYWWKVFKGPQVFRLHELTALTQTNQYIPNAMERHSQVFLDTLLSFKSILFYTSPVWLPWLHNKGAFQSINVVQIGTYAGATSLFILLAMFGRMMGRLSNPAYTEFMEVKNLYDSTKSIQNLKNLKNYDFSFNHFPTEFQMRDVQTQKKHYGDQSVLDRLMGSYGLSLPYEIFSYMISHTIGIRLVYPGTFLSVVYQSILRESRAKQIEQEGGKRTKMKTIDGNFIDSMFIDQRSKGGNGKYLMVCCEGNAGFYEVGCMQTPKKMGYSVLGWNHPGFGESTGQPFPHQEVNAVDVTMQYAIHGLKFQVENIYILAWSIGGFTAIKAANMYPDIKGLILDATFHDILPFAQRMMPSFINSLTTYTIRNHLNLWNSVSLSQYRGDVLLIRRTKDEVMNVGGVQNVESNMGNLLIEDLLWSRHPALFSDPLKRVSVRGKGEEFEYIWDWMSQIDEDGRNRVVNSYVTSESENLRYLEQVSHCSTGKHCSLSADEKKKLITYLLEKYVVNINQDHCSPLPSTSLRQLWSAPAVF